MFKLIVVSLLSSAQSFVNGIITSHIEGVLPPTTLFNEFLNVAVPIIVPAHGSIDAIHAIDKRKIKNYAAANLICYSCIPLIANSGVDIMPLFLVTSAIHFRHQFNFAPKPFNLLSSSFVVSLNAHHPELVYFFIAFIHTPHQYNSHKEEIFRNKEFATILITSLTVASILIAPQLSSWDGNIFITSTIIAHILYQESFKYA